MHSKFLSAISLMYFHLFTPIFDASYNWVIIKYNKCDNRRYVCFVLINISGSIKKYVAIKSGAVKIW